MTRITAKPRTCSGVTFPRLCDLMHLPIPVAEYRFSPPRKWRFDYAFVDQKVALEINGGLFVRGKHSRGVGQLRDFEKWSEAAAQGWRVIHVPPDQLESTTTFEWIRRSTGGSRQRGPDPQGP